VETALSAGRAVTPGAEGTVGLDAADARALTVLCCTSVFDFGRLLQAQTAPRTIASVAKRRIAEV
jgi:hypothetical protein